jgi:hypothetical protein
MLIEVRIPYQGGEAEPLTMFFWEKISARAILSGNALHLLPNTTMNAICTYYKVSMEQRTVGRLNLYPFRMIKNFDNPV